VESQTPVRGCLAVASDQFGRKYLRTALSAIQAIYTAIHIPLVGYHDDSISLQMSWLSPVVSEGYGVAM